MYRLTLEDHLQKFQPLRFPAEAREVAQWAIDQAKLGQWLSTRTWLGDLVTAAYVVEHLQLGVFIPSDPWAPLEV